jgi:hypothetical protein
VDLLELLSLLGFELFLSEVKLTHLSSDLFISIPTRNSLWSGVASTGIAYHSLSHDLFNSQISLNLLKF